MMGEEVVADLNSPFFFDKLIAICSDLNKNGIHRFVYLNAWSLANGTVWEGDVVLLKEVCHLGWSLNEHMPFLINSPLQAYVNSQLLFHCHACLSAALLPAMAVADGPSETVSSCPTNP